MTTRPAPPAGMTGAGMTGTGMTGTGRLPRRGGDSPRLARYQAPAGAETRRPMETSTVEPGTQAPTPVVTDAPARLVRTGGAEALASAGVTVRFGDLEANRDVSLTAREGMVTALIGPNGAGKTTFFNVLTGAVKPSSGTLRVFGCEVPGLTPSRAARMGVIRTFQNLKVLTQLTVFENVAIGASRGRPAGLTSTVLGLSPARRARVATREATERALDFVQVGAPPDALVADLPYGAERRVEIARALAAGPRVLLLDEPTAGMGPGETLEIGDLISTVVDDLGIPVFVVEHDMRVVRGFADVVHVLEQGAVIASGPPAEVLSDPRVIDVYLGHRERTHA